MRNSLVALIFLTIVFGAFARESEAEAELFPASMASGTLPIVTISTENGAPIVDKDTKIPARCCVSVPAGYKTLTGTDAAAMSDVALTIKGRGNKTWLSPKKPYKLKFDMKTEFLGLPAHRHWSLIPYPGYLNYISAVGGLEIGRATGMGWVPHAEPVELVINDVYQGRYFVVENIKISKNRLNIFEQDDLCEDPKLVPYGWLVEIDNNEDVYQIRLPECDGKELWVTHHSPEELSGMQLDWLTEEFTKLNDAIYSDDTSDSGWARLIDAASAARYFIVREIMWDPDGYSGSIYMHRDKGEDALWQFGPIWDVASVHLEKTAWVHESTIRYGTHWFPQLLQTRAFREALVEEWRNFRGNEQRIYDFYDLLAAHVKDSDEPNAERWPGTEASTPAVMCAVFYKDLTATNIAWIDDAVRQIEAELAGIDDEAVITDAPLRIVGNTVRLSPGATETGLTVYDLTGARKAGIRLRGGEAHSFDNLPAGIYIIKINPAKGGRAYAAKLTIQKSS